MCQYISTAQEIEAIKARVKEMEEEAEKLKEMQGEVEKQMMSTKPGKFVLIDMAMSIDSSPLLKQVDFRLPKRSRKLI